MTTPTIGIGVLSWRAHATLIKSLESYKHNGFLEMFDQRVIYFSDISETDKEIASRYGWEFFGGPNEGIAGGMKRLGESLTTDYILLLQNDNPIVETKDFAQEHIKRAVKMLDDNIADLARMRHRWKVGEGFADVYKYLKYYSAKNVSKKFNPKDNWVTQRDYGDTLIKKCLRIIRWRKALNLRGRSIFIEKNPEVLYPTKIQKIDEYLVIDSSIIHFTDQCLLISRKKWLELFVPYFEANPSSRKPNGFQAPEICINGHWWRKSHFKILQGEGVFTHARYDGSFRPEHPTNIGK